MTHNPLKGKLSSDVYVLMTVKNRENNAKLKNNAEPSLNFYSDQSNQALSKATRTFVYSNVLSKLQKRWRRRYHVNP